MTVDRGLLALLEATPGKGEELAAFLVQGRALAMEETGTVTWYAFQLRQTTYGIFDSFTDEEAAKLTSPVRSRSLWATSPLTCSPANPTSALLTSSPSSSRNDHSSAVGDNGAFLEERDVK